MREIIRTVEPLSTEQLTERKVNGEGVFDALMQTVRINFDDLVAKRAFDSVDSAKLFASLVESTLQNSVEFLLRRETTTLQNELLQRQIRVADQEIVLKDGEIEAQKVQYKILVNNELVAVEQVKHAKQQTQINDNTIEEGAQRIKLNDVNIQIALTDLELRKQELEIRRTELEIKLEDMALRREMHKLQLEVMREELQLKREEMQLKREMQELQLEVIRAELELKREDLALRREQHQVQMEISRAELHIKLKELEFREKELAVQLRIAEMNEKLIIQKVETERAQTEDKAADGRKYTGSMGAQIMLTHQQVQSFKDDTINKIARLYNDNFSVRKTADDGVDTPASVDKQAFNAVFKHLTTNSNIDIGTV